MRVANLVEFTLTDWQDIRAALQGGVRRDDVYERLGAVRALREKVERHIAEIVEDAIIKKRRRR